MAAYATMQDLIDRFGKDELASSNADLDQPLGTINEDRVALMLAQASSVIDSYLERRYQLPLSEPLPLSIIECCCNIARFGIACSGGQTPSDQITEGKKSALKWLGDIGAGRATLDVQVKKETTDSWSRVASRPVSIDAGRMY